MKDAFHEEKAEKLQITEINGHFVESVSIFMYVEVHEVPEPMTIYTLSHQHIDKDIPFKISDNFIHLESLWVS